MFLLLCDTVVQTPCRPYWRCYYANTDAVIYVVDSADKDRIGIAKTELMSMLEACRGGGEDVDLHDTAQSPLHITPAFLSVELMACRRRSSSRRF